nr:CPPV328 conserved hypothetical protein [Cooks petrelpox virus]
MYKIAVINSSCVIISLLIFLLTYYKYIRDELYEYIRDNKPKFLPTAEIYFSLHICGYIFLIKAVYSLYNRNQRYDNFLISFSELVWLLSFYTMKMFTLSVVISNINLLLIIYCMYILIHTRQCILSLYLPHMITTILNASLSYHIMIAYFRDRNNMVK